MLIIINIIGTNEFLPQNARSEFFNITLYVNSYFCFIIMSIILIIYIFKLNFEGLYNIFIGDFLFLIYIILIAFLYKTFRNVFLNKNVFPGGFHDASPLVYRHNNRPWGSGRVCGHCICICGSITSGARIAARNRRLHRAVLRYARHHRPAAFHLSNDRLPV